MASTNMMIRGFEIEVDYDYECELDPLGTGDSPKAHYVDINSIKLINPDDNVYDLFEDKLDDIESIIIAGEAQIG